MVLVGILSSETTSTSTDTNDEDGEKTIMDKIFWMYSGERESEQGKKGEHMSSVQVFLLRLREYQETIIVHNESEHTAQIRAGLPFSIKKLFDGLLHQISQFQSLPFR